MIMGKNNYCIVLCMFLLLSRMIYAQEVQDDIFYKTIIDKIVVYDRQHFDVYLNLLPHRWKVVLNSAFMPNDLCGSNRHTMYQCRSVRPWSFPWAWRNVGSGSAGWRPARLGGRRIG